MKQQHNTTTNSNYALYKKFIYTALVTLTICAALVFYLPLALTPAAFAILSIFIITTIAMTIYLSKTKYHKQELTQITIPDTTIGSKNPELTNTNHTSPNTQLSNENKNINYFKSITIELAGLIASFINFKDTVSFSLTSKSIFKLYLPIIRHLPLKNVVIDQGHSGF